MTRIHRNSKLLLAVTVVCAVAGVAASVDLGATGAVKGQAKLIVKSSEKTAALETITVPNVLSGVTSGVLGTSYTYSTGGSTSNMSHTMEYRFNWGDGTYSSWSIGTSATHSWGAAGTCTVTAEARCQTHPTITAVSSAVSVVMVAETVSVPSTPSGPAVGILGASYTYSTGGSTSSLGHTVEYRFNWGAGAYSTWSTGTSASHSWSTAGTYSVSAEARCQTHPTITTVSSALSVGVFAPLAVGGTTADMVLITAGGFNMGDTAWIDSAPVHVVHLDAFYIDKYEVTFDQYDAFCTATSRTPASDQGYGRGTRPVINITWDDSKAYCEWAGKRLPTEAEWEGACRAGTNTAFYWGDDPGYTLMGNYAWTTNNSPLSTQPVGGKLANAFGLYDMSGNVWEWVADRYDSGYYAVSPLNNPTGPASGTKRVMRGGAFDISGSNYGDYLRSGYRNNTIPANSGYWQGCRCAKTP